MLYILYIQQQSSTSSACANSGPPNHPIRPKTLFQNCEDKRTKNTTELVICQSVTYPISLDILGMPGKNLDRRDSSPEWTITLSDSDFISLLVWSLMPSLTFPSIILISQLINCDISHESSLLFFLSANYQLQSSLSIDLWPHHWPLLPHMVNTDFPTLPPPK